MANSFDKLKDLNLSRDEVNRIGEALQKPEFRKLLTDYVEELQDPKNKKIYEEEITQLEKERGVDIVFIHPNPGYVIKTSINGNQKAFINICENDKINKPNSSPRVKEGTRGLSWHLPHSLSPPHDDLDNKGARCQVFDIVFHPDTLHLAENNRNFRNMVNETALEAIEKNFAVKLDKKNLKFPKLTYKGTPRASVIRKASEIKPIHTPEEQDLYNKLFAQIEDNHKSPTKIHKKTSRRNSYSEDSKYTTPTYIIKYRNSVDIQEFVEHKDAKLNAAIPKELVIEINLPLLKSSSDIQLDVTEKTVQLLSEKPSKYKLNLTLPYSIHESSGSAKFDKDLKKIVITLPVKKTLNMPELFDSGVDSDHLSPGSPESEEERAEEPKTIVSEVNSEEFSVDQKSIKEDCAYFTDLRTKFLDENIHYNLPEFTCHKFENILAFTLIVKNVDENSVEKLFHVTGNSVHVKFTSIGSSFYPIHYSFYVQLPSYNVKKDETTIEVWDNNVILQVPVIGCDTPITSYLFGTDELNVYEKYLDEPEIVNKLLEENPEYFETGKIITKGRCEVKVETKQNVKVQKTENNADKIYHNKSQASPTDSVKISHIETPAFLTDSSLSNYSKEKHLTSAIDIIGTSYESSGDELSCSSFSPRRSKGILKRLSIKSRSFGRSISESSLDDFTVESSVENCHASLDSVIPEDGENDEEASNSLKKTVRFSDVIGRQLFR